MKSRRPSGQVRNECDSLPFDAAVKRLLALHDERVAESDPDGAAGYLREAILRSVRERSSDRVFELATQCYGETGTCLDGVLRALAAEIASIEDSQVMYELARSRAVTADEERLTRWFVVQRANPSQIQPDADADATAALARAYIDMGLNEDALRELLVAMRRSASPPWLILDVLVEGLISGAFLDAKELSKE